MANLMVIIHASRGGSHQVARNQIFLLMHTSRIWNVSLISLHTQLTLCYLVYQSKIWMSLLTKMTLRRSQLGIVWSAAGSPRWLLSAVVGHGHVRTVV